MTIQEAIILLQIQSSSQVTSTMAAGARRAKATSVSSPVTEPHLRSTTTRISKTRRRAFMRSRFTPILAEQVAAVAAVSRNSQIVRAFSANSLLRQGIAMLVEIVRRECPHPSRMVTLRRTAGMVIAKLYALSRDPWVLMVAHTPRSKHKLFATTCRKSES